MPFNTFNSRVVNLVCKFFTVFETIISIKTDNYAPEKGISKCKLSFLFIEDIVVFTNALADTK